MKILFVTPEFDKRIVGGLGTVVNGISFPLSQKTELDVMHLEFFTDNALLENSFNCNLYEIQDEQIKKMTTLRYRDSFNILQKYDAIHFFHYGREVIEFIHYIKANSLPIKIFFSCHYLLKYEQNIRCIYTDLLDVEQYIYDNVDCVHVLNQTSYNNLTNCYPALKQRSEIVVIPNGIFNYGYAKDYKLHENIKQNDFLILTVSRWCHGKGLECLLDAVPFVLNKYPEVKFIIGGRKEVSWENNVSEYVKKVDEKIARFNNNVFSLGWLKKEEIGSLLKRANLWVFPSELEYFPYGLLEPMIYNVPIITSRFTGFSEIIEEGKECFAFQPGCEHELAEKIIYLIENEEIRNNLSLKAYEKATTRYNWYSIAEQYYAMYRAVCKK